MRTNQLFSSKNFRTIWDLRTRKGEDLSRYFPPLYSLDQQKRKLLSERRGLAKQQRKNQLLPIDLTVLDREIELLRDRREALLLEVLDETSSKANIKIDDVNWNWGIKSSGEIAGKAIYSLPMEEPEVYFISHQVQYNLKYAFGIRAGNKDLISRQLVLSLSDATKKLLIRTDIKSFYESINHDLLKQALKKNLQISRTTLKLVEKLLREYAAISKSSLGVPRGIGISAMLAEIYMQELDERLKSYPGVIGYFRYVDDIAMVVEDSARQRVDPLRKHLRETVKRSKLKLNPSKTQYVKLGKDAQGTFQFLGYKHSVKDDLVTTEMSLRRLNRYKSRLDRAFQIAEANKEIGDGRGIFYDRIRFLTTNTRLSNNKRRALVGIYFSNSLLVRGNESVKKLDKYLIQRIKKSTLSEQELAPLRELSFEKGFNDRTFHKRTPQRLKLISRGWKYV